MKIDRKILREDEKKMADNLLSGRSLAKSAMNAFDYKNDERRLAVQRARSVLRRSRVIDYLERQGMDVAKLIVELGKNSKNETVKLNALKDILDRANIGIQKGTTTAIQINVGEDRENYKVE